MKKIWWAILLFSIILVGCNKVYPNACADYTEAQCIENETCFASYGSSGPMLQDHKFLGCNEIPKTYFESRKIDEPLCNNTGGKYVWSTEMGYQIGCDCNLNKTRFPYTIPKFTLEAYNKYNIEYRQFVNGSGCLSADQMCKMLGGTWNMPTIVNSTPLYDKDIQSCQLPALNRHRQVTPGTGMAEIWFFNVTKGVCLEIYYQPESPTCMVNGERVDFSKEFFFRYS